MKALAAVLLVGLAVTASGCVETLVSAVGVKAWEDRSTEDQTTDGKIHTGILKRLQAKDKSLVIDVSADVWEQRVMLTGTLDRTTIRSNAVKLARADKRIKALYNHIKVVSTANRDQRREQTKRDDAGSKSGVGQWVNDVWIETKIKGQLLVASGVTSVNFFWRSVLNDVYVIGRAKSSNERNKVLRIIRKTEGVRSVTHHIVVRPKA
jgi:osmotically-inducible protein OsmY